MATIPELLNGHVTLEVKCLDRLYLNGYIGGLATAGGLVTFMRVQLGKPIPSPVVQASQCNRRAGRVRRRHHGYHRTEACRGRARKAAFKARPGTEGRCPMAMPSNWTARPSACQKSRSGSAWSAYAARSSRFGSQLQVIRLTGC
jgi:hypothetical protein